MPTPVAIVILAWNSGADLARAYASAVAQSPAQIVVVDNASTDGAPEALREQYTNVHILRMAKNIGFAAGCNAGAQASQAPYLLFLNDDAQLAPGYAAACIAALQQQSDAASAVGKLWKNDGQPRHIDSAGIVLQRWALRPVDRGEGVPDRGQFDASRSVFAATGAAAVFKRSVFVAAGGFDASLFAYFEDVDLAWRLGRVGYKHLFVAGAHGFHSRRGLAHKPAATVLRAHSNRYVVWAKNESWLRFLAWSWISVPWELGRLLRLYGRDRSLARAVCAAVPGAVRRGLRARRDGLPAGPATRARMYPWLR